MRRVAALALRALPPGALRPQVPSPAPSAAAAARAFAWQPPSAGTRSGAPGPPRLAAPGEYLSGVAHSTQWRVGHRYKARAAAPAGAPAAALRSRVAPRCWWSTTRRTWTDSLRWLMPWRHAHVAPAFFADGVTPAGLRSRLTYPLAGSLPGRAGGGQRRWRAPAVRRPRALSSSAEWLTRLTYAGRAPLRSPQRTGGSSSAAWTPGTFPQERTWWTACDAC